MVKTHLLYHVYPVRGSDILRWNISQIVSRRAVFTGQKSVAVATGPETHVFSEIRPLFPEDWLVIEVKNDPMKRETAGWHELWPTVERLGGNVFWGHAKGVTRERKDYHVEAKNWTAAMYHTLLDFPLTVAQNLREFPITGSFKKIINGFDPESKSKWHYHGGMYWVREDLIPKWHDILPKWFATESWPGDVILDPKDAGCVFYDGPPGSMNLYNRTFSHHILGEVLPQWAQNTLEFKSRMLFSPWTFSTECGLLGNGPPQHRAGRPDQTAGTGTIHP